jgi:hypothetical protein
MGNPVQIAIQVAAVVVIVNATMVRIVTTGEKGNADFVTVTMRICHPHAINAVMQMM